jgi:hypothetical protein
VKRLGNAYESVA